MTNLLGWLQNCFSAIPGWIDKLGSSIGVDNFFNVLVALTGLSVAVAYLVLGLTGGAGSDKAQGKKQGNLVDPVNRNQAALPSGGGKRR